MHYKVFWKNYWSKKKSTLFFKNMGRESYDPQSYYIYLSYISKNLINLNKKEILLDCGGGDGIFSWMVYPYFKKIYLIDFSQSLINKSKSRFKGLKNIKIYNEDIRNLNKIRNSRFDKIFVGSVLQYLNSYEDINLVIISLKKLLKKNGIIYFAHNPDVVKKNNFIKSFHNLDWPLNKIKKGITFEKKKKILARLQNY